MFSHSNVLNCTKQFVLKNVWIKIAKEEFKYLCETYVLEISTIIRPGTITVEVHCASSRDIVSLEWKARTW